MKGIFILSNKWDIRYMELARQISSWSKDPSKKIGAVVIGETGQVLAQGYNGFPRGVKDTEERYNHRETKYNYIVHAEMNAIFNASWNGVSLKASTIYIYGLPVCHECAKGIIQTGIKRVVMCYPEMVPHWENSTSISSSMFDEANVSYSDLPVKSLTQIN
jgi:dCMP deaminase